MTETRKEQRRKKRRRWWIPLVLLLAAAGFWAFSNFTFRVTHTTLTSPKIQNNVRLALLSDLHGASFGPDNSFLVNAIRREQPDLVLALGDLYSSDRPWGKETALRLMRQLAEEFPVYFVPGEHDHSTAFYGELEKAGVHVLNYSYVPVTVGKTRLTLYGISNAYFSSTFDLKNAFDPPGTETYNILMAHIPNARAYDDWGPDLAVCGDTHGGVVQLPLWGPLYYQGSWLPRVEGMEEVYDQGLFPLEKTQLYVSGGLGNYPYPLRLLNRPELAIITLTPEDQGGT